MNLILVFIFSRAFPVWEEYQGKVPQYELEQLEQEGCWPLGTAAAIERLNRDKRLRKQLSKFLDRR
jgi:hypothetical protein